MGRGTGLADGWTEITTDTVLFVYEDELWEFPSMAAMPLAKVYKYKLVAPIAELRRLGKLMKIKPVHLTRLT